MQKFFGPHLIVDLCNCNLERLADKELIYELLKNLPGDIGMKRISEPSVFYYSGKRPEDHGITGVVVLAESHCSIHTFQEKGYCFVDIFSCKDFDFSTATKRIQETFESEDYNVRILHRGKNYPR